MDSVKPRVDQQGEGKVGIGCGVGRTKLHTTVFPLGRGDADQLRAVFRRPGDIPGRFLFTQTTVGALRGVQVGSDLPDMGKDSRHKALGHIPTVPGFDGNIDVHTVPAFPGDGLGRKVGVQAISLGHRLDNGLEVNGVVCRGQGVGVAEIDLILPGAFLMVGTLGKNTHALQGQTNLPADILPPILGRHI